MAKTSPRLLTTSLLLLSIHLMLGIEAIRLQPAAADRAEDRKEADLEKSVDQKILEAYGGIEEEQKAEEESRKLGQYLDGMDLILTEEQYDLLFDEHSQSGKEHGMFKRRLKKTVKLWPNGIVYYGWNDLDPNHRQLMETAFEEWERHTCISFQETEFWDQDNILYFTTYPGCSTRLGMYGGRQAMNLGSGCHKGDIYLHELGHVLGLVHEHQLPQRDSYISIQWDHVKESPTIRDSLKKYSYTQLSRAYDVEYDLLSIMHYSQYAFSADDNRTIIAHDSSKQEKMGMGEHLTFTDIKTINLFYNCSDHCRFPPPCGEECFVNEFCQCFCPEHMNVIPDPLACVDKRTHCPELAASGYCTSNRQSMFNLCRKSCTGCSTGSGTS